MSFHDAALPYPAWGISEAGWDTLEADAPPAQSDEEFWNQDDEWMYRQAD